MFFADRLEVMKSGRLPLALPVEENAEGSGESDVLSQRTKSKPSCNPRRGVLVG